MDSAQDSEQEQPGPPTSAFPESLGEGTTLLLCGFDPSEYDLALRTLSQFGAGTDTGVIVTTRRGAKETVKTYTELGEDAAQPGISIVDTVSEQQSISAMYDTVPTVFTPSATDIERLVIALSELTGNTAPDDGERHLVVPSLSPLVANGSTDRISDVLERITGLRTTAGFSVFGLDYTAHDESIVAAVAGAVDRVLWVTRQADGSFAFELRSSRGGLAELSLTEETKN